MTVVQDAITTEEILVADLEAEALLLEEKVILAQDVKAVSEANEDLKREDSEATDPLLQEEKVLLKELQDVQKALEILPDLEDQEEINKTVC